MNPQMNPIKRLIAALQFITILPLGKPAPFVPSAMVPYFPLAGLVIGGLLAAFDLLVTRLWPQPVAALLDVIFLIAVTGALHLDGVGDTAAGLYGGRTKEQALSIMKDSRLGAMGLVAICSLLAIKWAGLYALDERRLPLLILIPAFARGAMIFGMHLLPYGRPQGGTGLAFVERSAPFSDYLWLALPFALALLAGWRGLLASIFFVVITLSLIAYYRSRLGCITGDMLGAMCELNEALLFLICSIGWAR